MFIQLEIKTFDFYSPSVDGTKVGEKPFGRVESDDTNSIEGFQTELQTNKKDLMKQNKMISDNKFNYLVN